MRRLLILAFATGMFCCVMVPEQTSAQLFRRLWEDDSRSNNYSALPGANPNAVRAPDYGAEQVSEVIRNEVNGRTPVGAAPDFLSDFPLAQAAKQYRNPVGYTTQPPVDMTNRLQPPRSKFNDPIAFGPHWITPYSESEANDQSDQSDLAGEAEEISQPSDSETDSEPNPTVEL